MQHPAKDLPHHTISLFLTFPLKLQEEYTAAAENLGSPSFNLADQTHLPTIVRSLAVSHTSVNVFQVLPPPPPPPLPGENKPERLKSPPEGGECRKEGEGTLIWACNTVQFAIGQ